MKEIRLLDTNILLRFFTGDHPELAEKARSIIAAADSGEFVLEVHPLILGETIYTLDSFYRMPKDEITSKLTHLLKSRGIQVIDRDIMLDALARYKTHSVHFTDATLAAYAVAQDKPVQSMDKDFKKFKDVIWKS